MVDGDIAMLKITLKPWFQQSVFWLNIGYSRVQIKKRWHFIIAHHQHSELHHKCDKKRKKTYFLNLTNGMLLCQPYWNSNILKYFISVFKKVQLYVKKLLIILGAPMGTCGPLPPEKNHPMWAYIKNRCRFNFTNFNHTAFAKVYMYIIKPYINHKLYRADFAAGTRES